MENWNNKTNLDFYENIPESELRFHAKKAGLDSGCDVALAYDDIQTATNVLILGAGYGREAEQISSKNYSGNLTLVERSKSLCRTLDEKFSGDIRVINADILCLSLAEEQFDVVLWFWSGISDFNHVEQQKIIKALHSMVMPGGCFYIDTLVHDQKLENETSSQDHEYVISNEYGSVYGYKPSETDMAFYAKTANFSSIEMKNYLTSTGKKRKLYKLTT